MTVDMRSRRAVLQSLLLAAAGAAPAAAAAQPAEAVPLGGLLPDAPMTGLNGPSRRLSQFRGRPLVINVWASWCGPCRAEMASLERLAWHDAARGFTLIGISTDDHVARAMALLAATNATISHFIDRRLELETLLGAKYLPLTVLVDGQGRLVDRIVGAREWDDANALQLLGRAFGRSRRGAGPLPAVRPAAG